MGVIADMASGEESKKVSSRRSILPDKSTLQFLQVTGQTTQTDSRYSPMKPRSPSPRTLSPCLDEKLSGSPRQRLARLRNKGGSSSSSPVRRSSPFAASPSRPSNSPGRRSPLPATATNILGKKPDLESSSGKNENSL